MVVEEKDPPSPAATHPPTKSQVVKFFTPPLSPAALQPPVPGQSGMRPPFSYNIVPNANAVPAPGQQFQPATAATQAPRRPPLAPQASPFRLPAPLQSPGSASSAPGAVTPSQPVFSFARGPPATSNVPFAEGSQSSLVDSSQKNASSTTILNTSNSTFNSSSGPSSSSFSDPESAQAPANSSSTSTSTSSTMVVGSCNPNLTSSYTPHGAQLPRPPGAIGPLQHGLLPTASSGPIVTVQTSKTESSNIPSNSSGPPNISALPNSASFHMPVVPNLQQVHQPYSLLPVAAALAQTPWPHSSQVGLQHPAFVPFPGTTSAAFPLPMPNVSPILPANLNSSGTPTIAAPGSGTTAGNFILQQHSQAIDNGKEASQAQSNQTTNNEEADAWTAHKTDTGVIYYYNSVTGKSTYEKPANFKGEADRVTSQPIPVSWEKIEGTDWSMLTTNDGKKYYYDIRNKISSWQLPQEIVELRANQAKVDSAAAPASSLEDKNSAVPNVNTPALQTGGRDATVFRPAVAVPSSALDLVKKKLQDSSAPAISSPQMSTALAGSNSDSMKVVESSLVKNQESENNKERPKDGKGDGNLSDSSSDSDDTDSEATKEECIRQFKEMLKERGIAPFSKWEKELPKIIFDPRFKAIPSHDTRRSLFEHFVRTRAEEERREKRAAQKATVEGFKQLLEMASEDIDGKTDYQSFKRKWGNDTRFLALDRRDRELLLNERVLAIKKAAEEKMLATRAVVVSSFKSMLRERRNITVASRWSRVKESVRDDPRYRAVNHEDRETLFNEYLAELRAVDDEVSQAGKAKREEQEKLKRREQETRKRKQREEQEMESLKLKVRRKEAEASYQALLVETIKDPKASWTESKAKLEKDPQGRFTNSNLEQTELERLFREHVKTLFDRCANEYRMLLAEVINPDAITQATDDGKSVLTSWSEAKQLLKGDSRYSKMPSKDRESIWRRYSEDTLRKQRSVSISKEKQESEEKKVTIDDSHRRRSPRSHRRR